jgi:hypothetical protein
MTQRFMSLCVCLLLSGLVLGAPSSAFAQEEEDPLDELSAQEMQESREAFEQRVRQMDSATRKERSLKRIKKMEQVVNQTEQLLKKARDKDQDVRKLNCINDKFISMKGFLKVSENSYTSLREAESKNDEEAITHHYILIAVSYKRVLDLGRDAQMCVGQVDEVPEEGVARFEEDPDIVPVDPVLPGGYVDLVEIFDDVVDPTKVPPLTPLQ